MRFRLRVRFASPQKPKIGKIKFSRLIGAQITHSSSWESPERSYPMSKRGLQDFDEEIDTKAQFGQRRLKEDEDVEMGEFEDPWEDELEEEEEITVEGDDEEDEDEGTFRD